MRRFIDLPADCCQERGNVDPGRCKYCPRTEKAHQRVFFTFTAADLLSVLVIELPALTQSPQNHGVILGMSKSSVVDRSAACGRVDLSVLLVVAVGIGGVIVSSIGGVTGAAIGIAARDVVVAVAVAVVVVALAAFAVVFLGVADDAANSRTSEGAGDDSFFGGA